MKQRSGRYAQTFLEIMPNVESAHLAAARDTIPVDGLAYESAKSQRASPCNGSGTKFLEKHLADSRIKTELSAPQLDTCWRHVILAIRSAHDMALATFISHTFQSQSNELNRKKLLTSLQSNLDNKHS